VTITVAKEGQEECGFLGLDNEVPITVPEPLDPNLPDATEVWRGTLVNVASANSVPGEHNIYLMGIKTGDDYFFLTTDDFPNFEEEQGTTVLLRTVNLNCNRGDVIQYSFRIDVAPKNPTTTGVPESTTTPSEPTTTTEPPTQPTTTTPPTTTTGEPSFGIVTHRSCGGFGSFQELRVQGSEGAAANMTAGRPYQIAGDYTPVSASNFIKLSLSIIFEGQTVILFQLDVPDSSYNPGQRITVRFEANVPELYADQSVQLELRLSNHNSILESCIRFDANIFTAIKI